MSVIRRILGCFVAVLFGANLLYAGTTPLNITFQATLGDQNNSVLQGRKDVFVNIVNAAGNVVYQKRRSVMFLNGTFSMVLDIGDPSVFNDRGLFFRISVSGVAGSVLIPVPSVPYAVQSAVAETVLNADASKIVGRFTTTVNIQSNVQMNTDALFVDATSKRVGIGTTTPAYKLDINGIVNAQGFTINGTDIESALSWKKQGVNIYYNDGRPNSTGNVGIGTTNPRYALDVVGTLNATQFFLGGRPLSEQLREELSWRSAQGSGQDIYFDDGSNPSAGFVGIGTSAPTEKLDVRGAIRIGASTVTSPGLGTIQYRTDDFQGLTSQGWRSLTGIQGDGNADQLAVWTASKVLRGATGIVWNGTTSALGVGTTQPRARLDIKTDDTLPSLQIKDNQNNSILFVEEDRVGIGTSTPAYKLQVNGVIDAKGFLVNGQDIGEHFSKGSFWFRENTASNPRLFYDKGNVGIGTSQPRNLLELAGVTRNPAITFTMVTRNGSQTEFRGLYTLGVDISNNDSFIIAKGSDLSVPVFTFKGDKIGVGLKRPSANLHVSGNSGVVFSGVFGAQTTLPETGPGTKMIWYPAKAAFRAGQVLGNTWDESNLGNYSVGLGYSPLVSGTGAVAIGGYNNVAQGDYATVVGGIENQAIGNNSFAAGIGARAIHTGSFVWADYTVPQSTFQTAAVNQFLIRAQGGVGINTNQTVGSALTVLKTGNSSDLILRTLGNNNVEALAVNAVGNVGIGTSRPGSAKLAVMGGPVGIGTTSSSAGFFTIQYGNTITGNVLVIMPNNSPTAALLITASGNVGVGVTLGYKFTGKNTLYASGGILTPSIQVVDPNNPNGVINITPNPGSPWSDPSRNNGNTFRSEGMVGIGTTQPNSLLELSNVNPSHNIPVITFDINGVNRYSIGVTPNATRSDYLFVISPGSTVTTTPSISIATKSVGIGTGLFSPKATLHVSGNVIVSSNLYVATTNTTSPLYRMVVGGGINANALFINGIQFVPIDDPWKTNNGNIYFNGNVGIGISNPAYMLEVAGTVSVNSLLTNRPFVLLGDLQAKNVLLKDIARTGEIFGSLFVRRGEFVYLDPNGNEKVISSPLQKGQGATGNIAFWVDNSTLGFSSLYWEGGKKLLTVSGNLMTKRTRRTGDFTASMNTSIGGQNGMSIQADLSHEGNLNLVRSFSAENLLVNINNNWGNVLAPVTVKGLDVSVKSKSGTIVLNNTSVVGLNVDVSSANVNLSENGHKYAAIFKGGNVGIGTTSPQADLEVVGTVSANYFNLTGGLSVPTLVVNRDTLVAKRTIDLKPRVGIGLTNPEAFDSELTVKGTVSANTVLVNGGLVSSTMNINAGTFFVDASGNIGIGTTRPDGQLAVKKQLTSLLNRDHTSQKISLVLDGAEPGKPFYYADNLKGMEISIGSADANNFLAADAMGLSVDFSKLNVQNSSRVTGLEVNVTGTTGKRVAATFMGGFVGIGTTTPHSELEIVGTLNATNLLLRGNLIAGRATFNYLTVNKAATFNGVVTVNTLIVRGTVTANTLVLGSTLQVPDATFSTLNTTVASINSLLKVKRLEVATSLLGNQATFTGPVGIGITPPASGLSVSGNVRADSFTITNDLTLTGATLNVTSLSGSDSYLFASPKGNVGIGTSSPLSRLHVMSDGASAFSADNTFTWNPLRIQTKSNIQNVAAGIVLIPDNVVASRTVGSGIVALRAGDTSVAGSHLLFVTDPLGGSPQERLRITESGFIGIGTTTPTTLLDVNGSTHVGGDLTVGGILRVSRLDAPSQLTISTNATVQIQGRVSTNREVVVGNALQFKPSSKPDLSTDFGSLYVGDVDRNLYYIKPGSSTPVNLSSVITGASSRIPYFNTDGNLQSDAPLFWNNASKTFRIGTDNVTSTFEVVSTINNASIGSFSGHRVQMGFLDRSALTVTDPATFTGMSIRMSGSNPNDPTNFGRLANGETALGLKVDVTQLKARQFSSGGIAGIGYKYAAVFQGGAVGIGTSTPQAALHLLNEKEGNTVFRVDVSGTPNVLVIPDTGYVGVGVTNPTSRLVVKGDSSSSDKASLHVVSGANRSLLYVRNDGWVGIGTTTPRSELDVRGVVTANTGVFGSLSAATLNIGSGKLVVNASGNVGIGTTKPTSNISVLKEFISGSAPDSDFIAQKINLNIRNPQSGSQFFYNKNITGLDVGLSSVGNAILNPGSEAKGIDIDLKNFTLGTLGLTSSKLTGLSVDVTGTGGTRYAAIFMGGNVGIGTKDPEVALHVSGDVKANSLSLTGGLSATVATFNRILVSGVASFNQSVTINSLFAKTVSANSLVIKGNLKVATGSFTTMNVTSFATIKRLGIGVASPTKELDVSGSVYISRSVTVNGTLAVSKINGGSVITINATSGLMINGTTSVNSELRVAQALYLKKNTTQPATDGRGTLFVDATGHLVYLKPSSATPVRLSASLSGKPGKVPYYDVQGNLSSSANLSWDNTSKKFVIGSNDEMAQVELGATLNNNLVGQFYGQKIAMMFGDRTGVSAASNFVGMDIKFLGTNPNDPFSFGRLGNGESAIGLQVDVRNVRARFSDLEAPNPGAPDQSGLKYAALFMGGNVGIGTTLPQAAVHVQSASSTQVPFRVDTFATSQLNTPNALVVAANGNVGIGTSAPSSRLTIQAESNTAKSVFLTQAADGKKMFEVTNTGLVGIGTTPSGAQLSVSTNTLVDPFRVQTSRSALVYTKEGLLGVGTLVPSAAVHIIAPSDTQAFHIATTGRPNALVVDAAGNVGVGFGAPVYPLSVDGVVMSGTQNQSVTLQTRLPNWLLSGAPNVRGYLANFINDSVFLGMKKRASGVGADPIIWWGANPTDNFTIQSWNGTTTTNIISIRADGRLAISTKNIVPSASLHIRPYAVGAAPLMVEAGLTGQKVKALVVSASGNVGIGTSVPSSDLHVKGTLMATSMKIVSGDVSISTLNLTGGLKTSRALDTNVVATGQMMHLTVGNDMTNDITGLSIRLSAADTANADPTLRRKYTVWNGARATGLLVDVSGVEIRDPVLPAFNRPGYKVAANFLGGFVGISDSRSFVPNFPLHVNSAFNSTGLGFTDLARLGTEMGDLTVRDFGHGKIGFYTRDVANQVSNLTLSLSPSDAGDIGRVGIGVTNPSEALVVNGDMRVGVVRGLSQTANSNWGSALFFSGGPDVSASSDSDNDVPLWLARYNNTSGASELRTGVGKTGSLSNKFVVGYTDSGGPTGTYKPILDVRMNGNVGISDGSASFDPVAPLHVRADKSAASDRLNSHVMVIENKGSLNADSLAILHSGSSLTTDSHFITFFSDSISETVAGAIRVNSSASGYGVQYMTTGADYAEYLPKVTANEVIEKGDIVGVKDGYVSKTTLGAQQVMVKSSAPGVVGNWPGKEKEREYDLVAFFGQVPVKVTGKVQKGDYIVPSGLGDGAGIAVASANLTLAQMPLVVGTAWESSTTEDAKLIRTAVGFNFSVPSLSKQLVQLNDTSKAIKELKADRQALQRDFEAKLESQNKEIQALLKQLEQKK